MKPKTSVTIVISLFIIAVLSSGCSHSLNEIKRGPNEALPGSYNGYTLLPNGWKLSPAGSQVPIGELPLNMVLTNDGRYAITSNSGMGENSLSVVDLNTQKEIQRYVLGETWYGLAFNSDDSKLYVSGSNYNLIYVFGFDGGKLALQDSIMLGQRYPKDTISVTGVAYVKNKNYVLAVSKQSNMLYVCDANTKQVVKKINIGSQCYGVAANNAGTFAYISVWGNSSVDEIDLSDFKINATIHVGDHPCDMAISPDDSRLFVADANNNTASVVDLGKKKETERINSALTTEVPFGSTPNSVCLNGDGTVLMVANADNNYIALFDVSEPNKTKSLGFIPTGWYPSAVRFDAPENKIIVANGKGLTSRANPKGPHPGVYQKRGTFEYIGTLFMGTLSTIDYPNDDSLESFSKQVYANTPYVSKDKNWVGIQNVIPDKHDLEGSSKIKHVFYIIKENRTYDEVYGDMKEGNGDSSLCFFPYKDTPNQHTLSSDFTLYDNLFADAEVSADGHNWSTAAYATDYVEKDWPANYGRRGAPYHFEGGYPLAAPSSGYIWNQVLNNGRTFRNYGEFTDEKKIGNETVFVANDEDMRKYTYDKYPGWDLSISDVTRYKIWKKDFERLEKENALPSLSIMRLPNDHTWGTWKGKKTPQAFVAINDYALGLIVQTISHSKDWKSSIIFVVEDDAQDGSDHVDAHRSTLLVVSPYIKRNYVDHTMYSTSSVLKTIELVLGLPPMTQYDLSATPILFSVTDKPDFKPYKVIEPLIDTSAVNGADAYGAAECEHLNFAKEDAVPDMLFNEILWKAIKGKNSVMPPPVRSAFVKELKKKDKDDD